MTEQRVTDTSMRDRGRNSRAIDDLMGTAKATSIGLPAGSRVRLTRQGPLILFNYAKFGFALLGDEMSSGFFARFSRRI